MFAGEETHSVIVEVENALILLRQFLIWLPHCAFLVNNDRIISTMQSIILIEIDLPVYTVTLLKTHNVNVVLLIVFLNHFPFFIKLEARSVLQVL